MTQQSILQAAQPSADAVTLDIYWIRLPHTSDGADAGLWDQIHEDRLPVELRRRLASNGLRAGVVPSAVPDRILRMIDPRATRDTTNQSTTELRETGVRRRSRQLRPGAKIDLNASEVIDELRLAITRDDEETFTDFANVQGVYVLQADRAENDEAWVSLLPIVRHGAQRIRFTSDEFGAISRGAPTRDSAPLPDLAIAATLSPGEMLLVTNLPDSASQLGGLFHTPPDSSEGQRKAILVRVAGAPKTRAFLPSE